VWRFSSTNRHHVHLRPDHETAVKIGARRGKAIILSVLAEAMHEKGQTFYRSENGVWPTRRRAFASTLRENTDMLLTIGATGSVRAGRPPGCWPGTSPAISAG